MTRILVHEWASGGGLVGRPVPAALAREGRAMRDAVAADLQALPGVQAVMLVDRRFPPRTPVPGVDIVAARRGRSFGRLLQGVTAVWLIAPETRGILAKAVRRVEAAGVPLLGCSSAVIAQVSDKARLAVRLARLGIPHPATGAATARAAAGLGYPVVVKPALGAASLGVSVVGQADALRDAVRKAQAHGKPLVQRFLAGTAASVSLLCARGRTRVLAVNSQSLSARLGYHGGVTPFETPLAARAARLARRACASYPGLTGYVGVDVLLTVDDAFVVEINPRLTTAYLGLRASIEVNLAGLVLAACAGRLPPIPRHRRRVRFTAAGRVTPA